VVAPTTPISFCALCITIVENSRSPRKFFRESKAFGAGYSSRQDAKFGILLFLPLRLSVFAGDLPISFFAFFAVKNPLLLGCGFAALGPLWLTLLSGRNSSLLSPGHA
jgi:hypothetical protein